VDADLTGAGSQDARDFVFWQILFRHKAEVMAAFVNVRFGGDCVAKLPKCRAINFPQMDQTNRNRRAI
jgi:hypothetical protein